MLYVQGQLGTPMFLGFSCFQLFLILVAWGRGSEKSSESLSIIQLVVEGLGPRPGSPSLGSLAPSPLCADSSLWGWPALGRPRKRGSFHV